MMRIFILCAVLPGFFLESMAQKTADVTESTAETGVSSSIPTNQTSQEPDQPSAVQEARRPDDSWAVFNGTRACILIRMAAKFGIIYKIKNKAEPRNFDLSQNAMASGSCALPQPYITLSWDNYKFTVTFSLDKDTGEKKWKLQKLEVEFDPSTVFQNKKIKTSSKTWTTKIEEVSVPINKSLGCNQVRKHILKQKDDDAIEDATATISGLQVQAFLSNDNNAFGAELPCKVLTDMPKLGTQANTMVNRTDPAPIAVGSVFAVLTLMVVAGYAIYRSFFVKRVDYDTMEGGVAPIQ